MLGEWRASVTLPARADLLSVPHALQRPFVCSVCDANFQRDSHLKAHSRVHLDDSARPCACTEEGCEKKFWTNQHLKKHIEQVHRGNKYKVRLLRWCRISFAG
jgi:uncharacterized Zn-finger protein